jgi:T-complex protein 1 subunit beta
VLSNIELNDVQHAEHAGGDITSTFDAPEATKLGHAKLIEEIMIGEDRLIHFSGVAKAEACTIVLRGASGLLSFE